MTKTYKDIDCIADIGTPTYKAYAKISQTTVPYMDQPKYARFCVYFGVVLLFLLAVKKLVYMYVDFLARDSGSVNNLTGIKLWNKLSALSRRVAYKRLSVIISRLTGLPPSFGTLFVFFTSTLFVLCYAFIPHFWYRECRGFGSPPLAVRTGVMVMGLTPFLYIVSGKTNFISGITGISYEKLNVFHQALGWGSFVLSMVHTIPFLYQDVSEGGIERLHYNWNHKLIYRNGAPPLIFLFILCFGGSRFIRKYFYEVFWHVHWIMGLAYFATLTIHVYGLFGIEYMWATLSFWGAQMLYRALVKTTLKPTTFAFKHKEATVKAISDKLFEIAVPIKTNYEFFWNPGQHIFIRFMSGIHTLDNHPFSILTIPRVFGESELKLIVSSQKGLTKKIHDDILSEKSLEKKYKVYIDGPYGGMNRDCLSFDKLILVASGTGVAVTLPFMLHVAQNLGHPTNIVKQTNFIWVISDITILESISAQLIELLNYVISIDPKLLTIFNFNIFITNSKDGSNLDIVTESQNVLQSVDDDTDQDNNSSFDESKSINIDTIDESNYKNYLNIYTNKKPALRQYLQTIPLLQRNAIIVSGTASLQADVGNAASSLQTKVLKGEAQEVYLHTENFGW